MRELIINIRKLFTGEQDLLDAERILKKRSAETNDPELRRAAELQRRYRRRLVQQWTVLSAIAVLLVLILVISLIVHAVRSGSGSSSQEAAPVETAVPAEETESVPAAEETQAKLPVRTVTLSFVGDCTIGTDKNFNQSTSFNAYYEKNGGEYFLSAVKDIFAADDLTVVNMEGTFTTSNDRQDKKYAFKGDPSYVNVFTSASVEAANLANNHSKDYGAQSYDDTVKTLEDAGIISFGYETVKVTEAAGVKVGLTGVYELAKGIECAEDVKTNIAALKSQGAEVIVCVFHWGTERESTADSVQRELAHLAIDEGADIVIGHHPHVLQGIETYKDKTIAYSLGNFCFGGNKNPSDKDTVILQETFTVDNGTNTSETKLIPCSLSSSVDKNDYQPRVLEGEEGQRVLDKIEARSK